MICSVVTIVFAILTFFYPWCFIGVIAALVAAVAEYIVEIVVSQGALFEMPVLTVSAIVLTVAALVLGVIAIINGLNAINGGANQSGGGGHNLLIALLNW